MRHALGWSFAILAAANLLVGATAWALVPRLFGEAYRSALVPLLILLASGLAIGAAGIFGTALIALDRQARDRRPGARRARDQPRRRGRV